MQGTESVVASPSQTTNVDSSVVSSSRAGYLPIPLKHIPITVLNQMPIYLRARPGSENVAHTGEAFSLYASGVVPFTEVDRRRLQDNRVRFIYVRTADQPRLQRQLETCLAAVAADPETPTAEASALIYETSYELINEALSEPGLQSLSGSLKEVSHAVSTFVLHHKNAFSHLFATARHDFYTATHLVNVATWMVPLAYQLGHQDKDELTAIGQAGLLHDVGKTRIPPEIISKPGKLTPEEFAQVQRHTTFGGEMVRWANEFSELVCTVALQHHERQDGSGYPNGLAAATIHPVSKICAVADSFDAMTALRPYKDRALTVPEAMAILQSETPSKYDRKVVEAWISLIQPEGSTKKDPPASDAERRTHTRYPFRCPARVVELDGARDGALAPSPVQVVTHSLSRSGIGLCSAGPIRRGRRVRIQLKVRTATRECLEGIVVRCRAMAGGSFDLGVMFTQQSAELTAMRAGADDR